MKKEIYFGMIGLSGLIAGELMILYGKIFYGLGIHITNLLFMIIVIIFKPELKTKNIFQSITLLIVLQMIGFSIPQFSADIILQYMLIYMIMLLPIYYVINDQQMYKELGTNSRDFYIPILNLLTGIIVLIFQHVIFNTIHHLDITYINVISGEFSVLYLIISILIATSVLDTKYCTRQVSDMFVMSINSMLPILAVTLIFSIISVW